MKLRCRPRIRSRTEVEIPVIVFKHSAKAHQRWKDAQVPSKASGYADPSAFGRFAALINSGRFRPPKGGQAAYKFGEFYAALRLERLGYTCWSAVQLFDHRSPRKGFWKKNTDAVRKLFGTAGLHWPGSIRHALAFVAKTPDIVAYDRRRGWLFCEVKRPNDEVMPDQGRALAVIHLLTAAPVAIVRVVPRGHTIDSEPYIAKVAYAGAARRPPWLHSSHKGTLRGTS